MNRIQCQNLQRLKDEKAARLAARKKAKELEAAKAARRIAKQLKKVRRKVVDGRGAVCEIESADNRFSDGSSLGTTLQTSLGTSIRVAELSPSRALSALVSDGGLFSSLNSSSPTLKNAIADSSSPVSSPVSSPARSSLKSSNAKPYVMSPQQDLLRRGAVAVPGKDKFLALMPPRAKKLFGLDANGLKCKKGSVTFDDQNGSQNNFSLKSIVRAAVGKRASLLGKETPRVGDVVICPVTGKRGSVRKVSEKMGQN